MMEYVIVERSFDQPVEFDRIQAQEDAHSWCLDLHGVRFVESWFSTDRRRMICVYEAPDAEAVRIVSRQAKMPFDRIWSATHHRPPG